jgi:protein TonB
LNFAPRLNIVAALLVTALEVAMFVFGMRRIPAPTLPPIPMRVRLITLPLSTSAAAPPTTIGTPLPRPAPPAIETAPAESPPAPPPEKPQPHRHAAARQSHRTETPPPVSPPAHETALAPAASSPGAPSGGGTMGARAIYKPMPEIPEELRHHPMNLIAVARFHVTAGGVATVELIGATPDPRLNRALLTTLETWRFFPAIANGRPVGSTIDIRIPIRVE